MADRVSAHIMIGGVFARSRYPEFVQAIGNDNPASDWEGTPFNPTDLPIDTPLALMDHDVADGRFEEIEHICRRHGLHYVRWPGGYSGSFPSVRMLYLGHGEPKQVLTTEEDEQVFPIERIRELRSIKAIEAEYRPARMNPPPLVLVDDDPSDAALSETVHG